MQIHKVPPLGGVLIIVVILGILGAILIPRLNNLPTNDEILAVDMVQQYEEDEGRDRRYHGDLKAHHRGAGIYTVSDKRHNLAWIVDSNKARVNQADPVTGEIIEPSATEDPIEEPTDSGG